ncbi:hypothetical protein ABZW30_39365 [Kitasatospora sp. NPDC004669]|uniref:hypothetical protein n=1 Tax=Kitasatospora sp. NPDC004669 TaxID=3154555 RepID=UPI0033AAB30B
MFTHKSVVRLAQALCLGVVSLGATASPAAAQTPVICDPGALAAAITAANASGGTLDLAPGCTYILSSPLPDITGNVAIDANHSTLARSSSAPAFRILTVDPGANLYLHEVGITNGDATGSFGGGIANFGTLTLTNSSVRNNTADFSGGIGNAAGAQATIADSRIEGNQVSRNGGGIANDGSLTLLRSLVTGNTAGQLGGGIANDGIVRTQDSRVVGNQANTGGGIANIGGGTTNLFHTTVADNSAANAPGGILDNAGVVTLTDSRVHGNQPTNCAGSPVPVANCVN